MKKLVIVALLLVALLAGCGDGIASGTITEKTHRPEQTRTTYQCTAYNKNGTCKYQSPVQHRDPEVFRFDLRSGDKTGYVDVPREEYGQYNVGDEYPRRQ